MKRALTVPDWENPNNITAYEFDPEDLQYIIAALENYKYAHMLWLKREKDSTIKVILNTTISKIDGVLNCILEQMKNQLL